MTESATLPGPASPSGLDALRRYFAGAQRHWSAWEWQEEEVRDIPSGQSGSRVFHGPRRSWRLGPLSEERRDLIDSLLLRAPALGTAMSAATVRLKLGSELRRRLI